MLEVGTDPGFEAGLQLAGALACHAKADRQSRERGWILPQETPLKDFAVPTLKPLPEGSQIAPNFVGELGMLDLYVRL